MNRKRSCSGGTRSAFHQKRDEKDEEDDDDDANGEY